MCPRLRAGSADSMTTFRLRLATSPRIFAAEPRWLCRAIDRGSRIGRRCAAMVRSSVKPAAAGTGSERASLPSVSFRRSHDHAVSDSPSGHWLGELHHGLALLDRSPELHPGSAHRGPVKLHAAPAANDGRARVAVHALEQDEPDPGRNIRVRLADRGCRPRAQISGRSDRSSSMWASQANPSSPVSSPGWIRINPTSSRVFRSVANCERACDVDHADRLVGADIVGHGMPARIRTRAPRAGTEPPSQVAPADQSPSRCEQMAF